MSSHAQTDPPTRDASAVSIPDLFPWLPVFLDLPADLPQPVHIAHHYGGPSVIWQFPNGRGASVIHHEWSFGTELGVLRYFGKDVHDWRLDYSTPITDDVVRYIGSPDELIELLRQIRDLPPPNGEGLGTDAGHPATR